MILTVEGMTCGGCRARVEKALAAIWPDATVTLEPPQARLPDAASPDAANAALAAIGAYRVVAPAKPQPMMQPSRLTEASALPPAAALPEKSLATYYPLLLIAGFLIVASFAGTTGPEAAHHGAFGVWMTNFMAGFFLVFSFFKLLDLNGFASSYRMYDVVAARFPAWGYIYPFVELGLGFAYLFRVAPLATNITAFIVMSASIIGVILALRRKQTIRCACLGTVLNLPMSTVTLVEDGLMIAMSGWMIWMLL
jgi:copper chaperone CopZ